MKLIPEPERWPTADDLLTEARANFTRVTPHQAAVAVEDGAQLVDIRADHQRDRDGLIPGACVIARNVLEWRLDPASGYRDVSLARHDLRLILVCDEGYQSSLAAAELKRFGLDVTDLVGGFQAWRAAGLPVEASSVNMPE